MLISFQTFLLSQRERKALLQCARQAVPDCTIIAGVGGHSTSQVLEYIEDAYDAGADYALLLPSCYFGKQTTVCIKEMREVFQLHTLLVRRSRHLLISTSSRF